MYHYRHRPASRFRQTCAASCSVPRPNSPRRCRFRCEIPPPPSPARPHHVAAAAAHRRNLRCFHRGNCCDPRPTIDPGYGGGGDGARGSTWPRGDGDGGGAGGGRSPSPTPTNCGTSDFHSRPESGVAGSHCDGAGNRPHRCCCGHRSGHPPPCPGPAEGCSPGCR
uniref:(northern house mosquito) hypothetical protein n=1 Tax=Culex pipiens TaxID=7175 RepID=A0A8D8MML4_CULPI